MKLLTKELERRLPPLYSQENAKDPMVLAHFFVAGGVGDWYIIEGSRQDDEDFLMFGLCCLGEAELGYVTLKDFESVGGPFGLGIQRDKYWTPKPLSEVER